MLVYLSPIFKTDRIPIGTIRVVTIAIMTMLENIAVTIVGVGTG